MADNGAMKVFGRSNLLPPNRIVFNIIPNSLVRIEFWRIRWQEPSILLILGNCSSAVVERDNRLQKHLRNCTRSAVKHPCDSPVMLV
jgi:hypothetical protein